MAYEHRYLRPFSATTDTIGSGAVTSTQIADSAVQSQDIAAGAVTSEKIAAGAVHLAHLANDVPAVGIPDGAITEPKLADNAVSARTIKDYAINTSQKLGSKVIEYQNLADSVLESLKGRIRFLPQPKWILGPEIVGQSEDWTEIPLATEVPEHAFAVIIQAGINGLGPAPARYLVSMFVNTPPRTDAPYTIVTASQTPIIGESEMFGDANQGVVELDEDLKIHYKTEIPQGASAARSISLVGYVI